MIEKALQQRHLDNNPIRVAIVGAGATSRMIVHQLLTPIVGMRLVAIANRTIENAERAFMSAGADSPERVSSLAHLEETISRGRYVATDNAMLVTLASNVDVIVEATGTIEFGAGVVMSAIENRKHVILVNAELDSTIGPILKRYADAAGVVISNTDGDEPGVAMTLLRYLRGVGFKPVAAGNLKGLIDPYRTPETQKAFAEKYSQNAAKVTSFADGTKLSMEATILANATGFRVGKRGMYGPRCSHVKEIAGRLPIDQLLTGGLVDYALGAEPHTGAFVVVHEEDQKKRLDLNYYKMGNGPLYVFYTPYHLPHVQLISSIARAALFGDATVAPDASPVCDVAAFAKRDLIAGDIIDGVGGYMAYGMIENYDITSRDQLLPMGLSEGCRLKADVRKDAPITFNDVLLPDNRLCDRLRAEQDSVFATRKG